MVELSIIIVSYNTEEFLKACLQSVPALENPTLEIIVVDNASEDGSAEMVQKEFPKVILLENKINVGYSKGNNLGIKKAQGRYLLFLNPDTLVNKHALLELFHFMQLHGDAGASTCSVQLPDKTLDDACHRGFPTPWNAFCHFSGVTKLFPRSRLFAGYSMGFEDLSKVHEIDALAGAFMFVRREAGEAVGWWDEDFFWYGEDLDFCYRLKQKGYKIYFVPSASIIHYKGVSGGIKKHSQEFSTASEETKKRATLARFEAMKIFYRKHYMNKYPAPITWLVNKGIDLKLWFMLRTL